MPFKKGSDKEKEYNRKRSKAVTTWRRRTKEKIIAAMGGQCCICHYNKCNEALELHHINPEEKELTLGNIRANPRSLHLIAYELKKCVLLCANCHREIHFGKTILPECLPVFDEKILMEDHPEIKENLLEKAKIRHQKIEQSKLQRKYKERKIQYTNEEFLHKYMNEFNSNASAFARSINVSEASIRKRLNKIKN